MAENQERRENQQKRANTLRVGLMQLQPTLDVAANLQAVLQGIAEAMRDRAELIVVPENGLCIGSNQQMRAAAIHADGPEMAALRQAARQANAVVVLGGFKQKTDATLTRNVATVINAQGEIAASYDKIHLFDAVVAGTTFRASDVERAGRQMVVVQFKGVNIGLSICFDVRFPEMYRQLALAGAQVLLVPAAFTRTTGSAHWEVLLRARAIENAAYVVASATVAPPGAAQGGFETYGHALLVDPWGAVLADLGEAARAVQVIEIDLDRVAAVRQNLPVLKAVKPEVYAVAPTTVRID